MKHFPSAVHWKTREAALPRRRRLGYLARHESTRSCRGTGRPYTRDLMQTQIVTCSGRVFDDSSSLVLTSEPGQMIVAVK